MKTLTIGDIHGRPFWKKAQIDEYDRVICVGDIMDSSRQEVEDNDMFVNTKEILKLKEENPEKVILIPGNHDLPYIFSYDYSPCSRFRRNMYPRVHELYVEKRHLFQAAFQYEDHIWTHAGVLRGWYEIATGRKDLPKREEGNLAQLINELFLKDPRMTVAAGFRRGGYDPHGGPFWADRSEHMYEQEPLPINQIVGHSRVQKIETIPRGISQYTITFTDCQDWIAEFYELELP